MLDLDHRHCIARDAIDLTVSRGRPKKTNGRQWLTYSRSATLYKSLRKGGTFCFSLFSEFLKGEKHEIFNSDGLNPLIMNLEASRYIFTTPKPSSKTADLPEENHPWCLTHPIPTSPISTPIHWIPSPKNPWLLCLKDKVARTNVFEWIIFGIPFCHQAILSSTKLVDSLDVHGCHGWMSWASSNPFLEGNCQAVFFFDGLFPTN